MANKEIRFALMENNIKHYELAEQLNIWPENLSKMLRHELPNEEKTKLLHLIETMARERNS